MTEATRRTVTVGAVAVMGATWTPPALAARTIAPTAHGREFRRLMVQHYQRFLADFHALESPSEATRSYYRLVSQLGSDELAAFDRGEGEWWEQLYGHQDVGCPTDQEVLAAADKLTDLVLRRIEASPDFPVFA